MALNVSSNWRPINTPKVRLWFCVASTIFLVVVLFVVPPESPQNALWWDYLMGLGYVATGLLLILPFITTRFWFLIGGGATSVQSILVAHRIVTYLCGLILLVHIVGLVLIDPTIIEYLKPSAPWGMVAALLATLVLILSIAQSEFRIKLNMRYNRWRSWHIWLSVLLVSGTFFHIYEAKYFMQSISEMTTLGALAFASGVLIFAYQRKYQPAGTLVSEPSKDANSIGVRLTRFTIYAALICSIVVFIYSIPSQGNRAERQVMQCLIDGC